jgi:hypothetical protein
MLRKSLCILSYNFCNPNAIRFSWNQKIGNYTAGPALTISTLIAWELEWKNAGRKSAGRNKIYTTQVLASILHHFQFRDLFPFRTHSFNIQLDIT